MDAKSFKNVYTNFINNFDKTIVRDRHILNYNTIRLLFLLNKFHDSLTLIPNLSMGELSLCADKWQGYSYSNNLYVNNNNKVILEDFLSVNIERKYKSIILFPPVGVSNIYDKVSYINKCLNLLDDGGRLIAIVPQNITTAKAFKDLRDKILSEYSLEAVFTLKHIFNRRVKVECSIIVIDNKIQTDKIYMSVDEDSADNLYKGFISGRSGFFTDASEVYDRIDANYFDPQYKEIRNLVQNRDTVKLSNLAEVFNGIIIPSQDIKDYGDYLIIKPQYIFDGEVHLETKRKVFCSKKFIETDIRGERCILKKGDVLISTIGKASWAIYSGNDNFAVASHNIVIIRSYKDTHEWLQLFFHSKTGNEYLESQLKFFSHCSTFSHISISNIMNIAVPDIKMMGVTNKLKEEFNFTAKVAYLFKDLGWDVKENYQDNNSKYDIALFYNGCIKAVIDVKLYSEKKIRTNKKFILQLKKYEKLSDDISIYFFIDDEIYEYIDGDLEQLSDLPRPTKEKNKIKQLNIKKKQSKSNISIKKKSIEEISITDKTLLEITTRYDEIKAVLNRIEVKIDNIDKKLEDITKQISGYQSLVHKQLDMAISPEEQERIIHAFSEECAEQIISKIDISGTNNGYNVELNKLIISFGKSAWNKMENESRRFLISSKFIFNNLIGLQDIVDYSGVCLLVTKALEVEMGKRFCKNFLAYLNGKYEKNYVQFPTGLINQYGKPIKPKQFTLGSVAYVLCHLEAKNITKEQSRNNKAKLLEYAREKLFVGKPDNEIMDILDDYAESVEEVKNNYRNPSAHTNELKRINAVECFDLVIDVEKLMKKMLDSFDE